MNVIRDHGVVRREVHLAKCTDCLKACLGIKLQDISLNLQNAVGLAALLHNLIFSSASYCF